MTVWAQSSQAATWPPSSALRQASMAAIAFNCPRLRCPALALRQAAPWLRKISATSSAGRDMARRLSLGLVLLLDQAKPVERAHHLADRAGGHARVERRRVELGVAEGPEVIMLTFYVIETEGFAERDQLLADAAGHSARDKRRYPPP